MSNVSSRPYADLVSLRGGLEQEKAQMSLHYPSALFGTINYATDDTKRQVDIMVAGVTALAIREQWSFGEHYVNGLGEIARIECLWDERGPEVTGYKHLRGMVIFTSGANRTIPLVYYQDALLGYGGAGANFGRHILSTCGVPQELIQVTEDELEHHDYQIVLSREKTYDDDYGAVVAAPHLPPHGRWKLIHKERFPRRF